MALIHKTKIDRRIGGYAMHMARCWKCGRDFRTPCKSRGRLVCNICNKKTAEKENPDY